jgi:nucleoside-diphosphate-sugar epimerase
MHIKDLVSLYLAVMEQKPEHYYIFNGGTGVESMTSHVVMTVEKILGKKLPVQWGIQTPRPWEPEHWRADVSVSKKALDWSCQYTLEQGLKASLDWFRKNISLYTKDSHENRPKPHSSQSTPV